MTKEEMETILKSKCISETQLQDLAIAKSVAGLRDEITLHMMRTTLRKQLAGFGIEVVDEAI